MKIELTMIATEKAAGRRCMRQKITPITVIAI